MAFKEYAHISNEILEGVKDIDYTVEMPNNEVVPVTLMFVDTSKAALDRLLEELEAILQQSWRIQSSWTRTT